MWEANLGTFSSAHDFRHIKLMERGTGEGKGGEREREVKRRETERGRDAVGVK